MTNASIEFKCALANVADYLLRTRQAGLERTTYQPLGPRGTEMEAHLHMCSTTKYNDIVMT